MREIFYYTRCFYLDDVKKEIKRVQTTLKWCCMLLGFIAFIDTF